ncbi:InlB B-repeat-containing protein [Acetobacterium bakii]|uniref:Bacterial repeat domain-containing protein n=1 Tax=Acetobacterium bakii TaxID=52689 RepID=A0A0L6U272_9FIRM|nr:InlB B-repeat-containing protein [Acetobacterium bakii]KNZ42624.1 hypothetical protein AKG39_05610 [Acetobacterium bakii]
MKFLKNLALMLSLVLVLNTILPQAAVFAQEASNNLEINGSTVNVTLTDFNPAFGTVTLSSGGQTGPGVYPKGSILTINAVANPGYEVYLVYASMGGRIFETPLPVSNQQLDADTVISVAFISDSQPVSTANVYYQGLPAQFGSMSVSGSDGQTGNGDYPMGSTLNVDVKTINGYVVTSIVAYFDKGYTQHFDNTTSASFILTGDVTIEAQVVGGYNIVVESSDPTRGTVFNETGSYSSLDSVYLCATGNPGYECTGYYFIDANNQTAYTAYTEPVYVPVTESGTYQMIFGPTICTVAAVSAGNGTVIGGGNVANGSKVTLTATPNAGYKFSQWTDENTVVVGTNPTLSITVTDNGKYTASFVPDTVEIQVSADPTGGGTVSGSGTYVSGTSVTLTATPAENYCFVQWINPQTQAVISKKSNYTFTASAATSGQYSAVFEVKMIPVQISKVASPASLQSITVMPAAGNYASGTVLPLEARWTGSAVTFLGWYANGVLLSSEINFNYTVTEPVLITAVFDTDWGSVIVFGNPFSSRTVDIDIQPIGTSLNYNGQSDNYDFVNWTNPAGAVVSSNPNLDVEVQTGLQTFIANVTPKIFTISVIETPTRGGTVQVTSDSSIPYGKNATVEATASPGYSFNSWTDGDTGQIMSTTPTYTFGPEKNTNLVAHFTQNTYALDLTADPSDGGTVVGSADNLTYGQVVNIQAIPNDEYNFNGWVDEYGNTVSTSAKYSVTIVGNMSLTATFSEIQYPISATANPSEGGTVTGSGSFVNGAAVTLNATPSPNYNFIRWTLGDSELAVSSSPQYSFTASEATQGNYTAVFELKSYSVDISLLAQASVADQVTITPQSGLYSYGTVLPLDAVVTVPNPALRFLGWYENGKELSKDQNFDYTVTQATKLSAIFVTDYGVIISYGDPLGIQPPDVIIAPMYENKTISAATNLPYNFVNWTDSDGNICTDSNGHPYTISQLPVTVGPDWVKTYVAHYAPKSFNVSVVEKTPGGTASASRISLLYGEWLTVTAVPDPGYVFVNWTDIPTGNVFSRNPNWTFLPADNVNLQANFSQIAYTVDLNADAEGGGTVAWADYPTDGPYYGDIITAVATPDPNFVFDGWVNAAGDIVTGDSSLNYTVTGNDTLTGAFHASQNTITAVANPATMGTATGGAVYNYKDQATLTATPNTGFGFINWTNSLDDTVITTPSLVLDVAEDITYTANFEILPCPVTLNFIDPSRSAYGNVEMKVSRVDANGNMDLMPDGTVPIYGDQVVLTATPNTTIPNVLFKDYLDGNTGVLITYDAVYTIAAIAEPMDIQYDFVQEYTVVVPVSAEWTDNYQRNRLPGVFPQVTQFPNAQVSGNFKDSVTLNYGTVDPNLVFDGWYTDTDTPVLVSSELSFSYQLLDTTPLIAKLHLKDIGIPVENAFTSEGSVPGVDLIGGEVSGNGYRNVGETFNISASVDADYSFENWTQGTEKLSKTTSFTYIAAGQPGIDAIPLQANYSPKSCYLTVTANPKAGGNAAPSGYYPYGTLVTVSQGNQADYKFSHFEDEKGKTLTSAVPNNKAGTINLYITGNTTVVAVYNKSNGDTATEIVKFFATIASLAAIAAGIAAAIYLGEEELLADAEIEAAEVAFELLEDIAAGITDDDPDPDPDDNNHVTITTIATPAEAGMAIGGEAYRVGEMAVLKATANPGWVFENWTCSDALKVIDDPLAESMSFFVNETEKGSIYTAHFKEEFTITTNATPEVGGTVTATHTVVSGEPATVTATANENYIFDGWYENELLVSPDEIYTLDAVLSDHILTAQFELGANVNLTCDPVSMDEFITLSGNGLNKIGEEVTVTAVLDPEQTDNYIFKGWYAALTDEVPLSTEAIYTFILEEDTTLIASYEGAVTITTNALPDDGGTVTLTQEAVIGDTVTLTATPAEGYVCDGWFEDEAQVSEDETYTFEAATDRTLTAQFELGANVTLTSDPLEMEPLVTLTGDGCRKIGEETTVTAVLDEDQTENYIFNGWYASLADDVALSTSETYTFILEEDTTLIASYKENSFTVDVTSEDVTMGTVSQTGTNPYKLSDSVTVTAVSEKGYKFAYWSNGNSVSVSQLAEYTFDVTDDETLIANFVGNSVKIQVQCDYVEGGTVTSDDVDIPETGLVTTAGESITLKAEEKKDYEFEGWYENGKKVEKKDTYTFVAEKDRTLVAAFSHKGLWLLAFPDPIEGGRVYKIHQTSETKDEFYLNAVPLTGYEFVGWYDILGIKVCDTPEYDFVGYIDHIIFGKFKPIQYNVSVDIESAQGGTVSGTGTSDYGKPVTLTATPKLGYVFNGYSDSTGSLVCADAVYTFTIREDVQLTANFSPQTYNVTATVNDPNLGSVSDAGTYPAGESVSLEASPVAGARLVGWFENGQCVSQESTYTFTATADRNLEVDFSNEAFVLTIMADPVSGGSVSGEGGYNPSSEADQASISAIPSPGYAFTAWIDAETGEQVSILSSDAITLTKDTNLTAVFTPNIYQVNVTSGDGGSATGNGSYNFGQAVTLSARADMGYAFAGWMMTDTEGNQSCISPDLDYTFNLNEDWINNSPINISATFKNTKGALIIPLAQEYLRGNIARGYHLDATVGDTTTVEAIPGYGYEFTNWTDIKGNVLSQDAVYTFIVAGDTVLMAHFKSTETVKLTVTEESILQGKAFLVGAAIAGEKEVESGQYVMVYAVAYPGNKFLHWVNQNGLKVSNARCHLFRISEDTTLTAVFEKTTHDIRANVDPERIGYVFGQKTYTYGDTAMLTAIPLKSHYILAYWSDENGRIKGAVSPVFRPVVNGTKTYTAHFIKVEHEITATAVPAQGGTAAGGGFYADGDSVTLTATANEGYQFDGWFVNEVCKSTDENWSFSVSSHLAAEAHFSLIPPVVVPYLVTAIAVPDQGGTVTGVGSFNPGDLVTLTATANDGYQFDGWFVDGVSASSDTSWTFSAASNLAAEAHFSLIPPVVVTYQVRATAVPDQGGIIIGGGSFNPGDPVTLSATTNDGYQFDGWFVNGVSASTDASWTFSAASDLAAEAHFSLNPPGINEVDRYQPILQNNSGLNVTATGDLQSILTGPDIQKDTTAYAQLILDKIELSDIGIWDQRLIENIANGQRVGLYLNIRLNMLLFNYLLNSYGVKELSELNQPLQMSIDIGNLINEGTDFRLIRIHNGVVQEIPSQLNGSILSFGSQYFSTFAVVYTPVAEIAAPPDSNTGGLGSSANETGLGSNNPSAVTIKKTASVENPKTGEPVAHDWLLSGLLLSLLLGAGIHIKKRKASK